MNTAKTIKELRESIGMSRKEFSEHTGIPVRTLEVREAMVPSLAICFTSKRNIEESGMIGKATESRRRIYEQHRDAETGS